MTLLDGVTTVEATMEPSVVLKVTKNAGFSGLLIAMKEGGYDE